MSSWFAEKVSGLVKDAQRLSSSTQCTADELAAELTQQARGLATVENVSDLLTRWNEQIKSCTIRYPLAVSSAGGGESLSFHLVLLRSQAFETLLDTCARVPAISAVMSSPDFANTALGRAMLANAEQILLPGSLRLWPTLLEALLEIDSGSKSGPKWRPWARHVLTSMKRRWESEALATATRTLDRQLGELSVSTSVANDEASGSAELQRQGAEGKLSKRGIRAALARSKLRRCAAHSESLKRKTDLLSGICERLTAMEGCTAASVPNLERLVSDASKAIGSLDSGEEKLGADQESLGKDLSELGEALEKQLTGVLLTQEAFSKKRIALMEDREALMQRVSEIDAQIAQLDEESGRCKAQVTQLKGQYESMTKHYASKNDGVVNAQRGFADNKIRAFSFRSMSEQALSVAQAGAKRHDAELRTELQRRTKELRQTCLSYIQSERTRLNTAKDCLYDNRVVNQSGSGTGEEGPAGFTDIGEELADLMSVTQGAWRNAQSVLQRVEPLVVAFPLCEMESSAPSLTLEDKSTSEKEVSSEEIRDFFSNEAWQGCVDCGQGLAEWASVSYGVQLCVDCAGTHRGFGVHLSFVRSQKMDRWTIDQLQRMKLGGNSRFREFLEGFPELCGPISSAKAHMARYASRAVGFYRARLEAECSGGTCSLPEPSPEEGHLLAEAWPAKAQSATGGEEGSPLRRRVSSVSDGEGSGPMASLQEERAELEAVYLDLQCRLRDALVPQ